MSPVFFAFVCCATFSTLVGGWLALRLKSRLPLIMSFTAGVLLGVVFLELLPELFHLSEESDIPFSWVMGALVAGFLMFHLVEKAVLIHHSHEGDYAHHHHPRVGKISAATIIAHSFLDGLGIGLAFQVDARLGVLVATAVIAHNFTDGMNTVTLALRHGNSERTSRMFLLADAAAPALGAFTGLYVALPEAGMAVYLAFFAGFMLYIGASDILPAAHSDRSSYGKIALTFAGVALMFVLAGTHGHGDHGPDHDDHADEAQFPAAAGALPDSR